MRAVSDPTVRAVGVASYDPAVDETGSIRDIILNALERLSEERSRWLRRCARHRAGADSSANRD